MIQVIQLSPALLSYNAIPQNQLRINIPINLANLDDVNFGDTYVDNSVVTWDESTNTFILTQQGGLPPGEPGDTLRYGMNTGEGWLATSNLYNDGLNIGINTIIPEDILHINGNILIENYIRLRSSDEPSTTDVDEIKTYITSDVFRGYGYFNKVVKLCTKGENGEEVIVSSFLT